MVPAFGPTDVAPSPFNATKTALEQFADFLVSRAGGGDAVAIQDPAGISIYHEYKVGAGLRQDGARCRRGDARPRPAFRTRLVRRLGQQEANGAAQTPVLK